MNQDDHESVTVWPHEADDYYDRVMTLAQDCVNYAGARLDDGGRELVVFTVGSPSDALAALIRAAPQSLRATWREAPYTLAELTSEVLRLLKEQPARLSGGGAEHDGTGIVLLSTDSALVSANTLGELIDCSTRRRSSGEGP